LSNSTLGTFMKPTDGRFPLRFFFIAAGVAVVTGGVPDLAVPDSVSFFLEVEVFKPCPEPLFKLL